MTFHTPRLMGWRCAFDSTGDDFAYRLPGRLVPRSFSHPRRKAAGGLQLQEVAALAQNLGETSTQGRLASTGWLTRSGASHRLAFRVVLADHLAAGPSAVKRHTELCDSKP